MKISKKHLQQLMYGISGLSIWITIGFVVAILLNLCKPPNSNTWTYIGQLGDFFGGIVGTLVAIIGFILIYLSFKSQTKSQKEQEKQFIKSQIESRFFELVKLHRENIDELVYRGKENEVLITGRKVFKEVYEQIKLALDLSGKLFAVFPEDICLKQELLILIPKDDRKEYAKITLAYSIVFFGVSKEDDNATINALEKAFTTYYSKLFYDFFRLVPAKYSLMKYRNYWDECLLDNVFTDDLIKEAVEKYENDSQTNFLKLSQVFNNHRCWFEIHKGKESFFKRFGGHQHKLGHYFRHLYQTVTYIDNQAILSYAEKYEYIKTLRAQLSNYEQIVFFFNSFHYIGRIWELYYVEKGACEKFLISKYNFIKNIPDVRANGIDIKKYYPLIDFEFEESSKTREAISREYWE